MEHKRQRHTPSYPVQYGLSIFAITTAQTNGSRQCDLYLTYASVYACMYDFTSMYDTYIPGTFQNAHKVHHTSGLEGRALDYSTAAAPFVFGPTAVVEQSIARHGPEGGGDLYLWYWV